MLFVREAMEMNPANAAIYQLVNIGHGPHCASCRERAVCVGMLVEDKGRPGCHSGERGAARKCAEGAERAGR